MPSNLERQRQYCKEATLFFIDNHPEVNVFGALEMLVDRYRVLAEDHDNNLHAEEVAYLCMKEIGREAL